MTMMTEPDAATPDGGGVHADPTLVPQRPISGGVLGALAERRQQIASEQIRRVRVPRWDKPQLWLVFQPIDHDELKKAGRLQERVAKEKDPHKLARVELDANADLLIGACVEIYTVQDDGSEIGVGPNGAHTRFDPELAESLGLPRTVGARATLLPPTGVFITDADVLAVARDVAAWSGYTDDMIDTEIQGES